MAVAIPIALGVASLASKLFGSLSKHKAEQKKADALKAEQDRYRQEAGAANDVDENRRVERLNAVQGLLQRTGGSLRQGAPDYTFDPAVLQRLQTKRPFVNPLGNQTDPKAGLGWGTAADVGSGVGSMADQMLASYYGGGGSGVGGSILNGSKTPLSGQADFSVGTGLNPVTPYGKR